MDGQARLAGVPYEEWKSALADEFIVPYIRPETTVIEIAAGTALVRDHAAAVQKAVPGRSEPRMHRALSPSSLEQ